MSKWWKRCKWLWGCWIRIIVIGDPHETSGISLSKLWIRTNLIPWNGVLQGLLGNGAMWTESHRRWDRYNRFTVRRHLVSDYLFVCAGPKVQCVSTPKFIIFSRLYWLRPFYAMISDFLNIEQRPCQCRSKTAVDTATWDWRTSVENIHCLSSCFFVARIPIKLW